MKISNKDGAVLSKLESLFRIILQVEVFFERFKRSDRFFDVTPGVLSYIGSIVPLGGFAQPSGIDRTEEGALYYRLSLPGLYHIRQGLALKATARSCSGTAGKIRYSFCYRIIRNHHPTCTS